MEVTVSQPKGIAETPAEKATGGRISFLFLLVFCVDFFLPFLLWKGYVPSTLRWVSHGTIALMALVCVMRMIHFKRVPHVVWLMLGVVTIWSFVAVEQGQGISSTAWGVWMLLQFPIVGLFSYLAPRLPTNFADNLRKYGLILLALEVVFQLIQYRFLGEIPGDNLAGFFGKNGTGFAAFFTLLVNCLFLGYWIKTKKWFPAVVVLLLSILVTTLGEVKLFPVAIACLGLVAMALFAFKHGSFVQMFELALLMAAGLFAYNYIYNLIIPDTNKTQFLDYLTNPQKLDEYLNISIRMNQNGTVVTNIGRDAAFSIGWQSIQRDPVTLLFGWGVGARSESQTLGTAGVGLKAGDIGLTSGTTLLVMMQELGLVGLAVLAGFFIWIIYTLARDIRRYPQSSAVELRYGLILFTLFWPVWMWYSSTWNMRVSMILYWFVLGYTLAEARLFRGAGSAQDHAKEIQVV